jgi:hypothetical protein
MISVTTHAIRDNNVFFSPSSSVEESYPLFLMIELPQDLLNVTHFVYHRRYVTTGQALSPVLDTTDSPMKIIQFHGLSVVRLAFSPLWCTLEGI